MNNLIKEKNDKKSYLTNTGVTILIISSIILITVIINIGLEKSNIKNIDITKEKLYSLSNETKEKLKNINTKITILVYEMNNYPEIINFIKLYKEENNNINYEIIKDISTKPELQEKFGLGIEIKEPAIIIKSDDRSKLILANEFYDYNNNTYEEYDLTEEVITNGILDVNLKKQPNIYYLKNHNEKNVSYFLSTNLLENESNVVKELDLLINGKVPEDCDILLITSLEEDITKYERDLIEDYINKAGNLMILQAPRIKGEKILENFNYILDLYGVTLDEGVLIEDDIKKMILGYKNIIIPNSNFQSEIANKILRNGKFALLNSGTIKFDDNKITKYNIRKEDLIYSSSTCKREKNDIEKGNSNEKVNENSVIASMVFKPIINDKESKLIICANSLSFSDMMIDLNKDGQNQSNSQIFMLQLYNNKDFLINSISYLSNRTDNLIIRKDTGAVKFIPTHQQNIIIKVIILILPIIVILIGVVIKQKRIRK